MKNKFYKTGYAFKKKTSAGYAALELVFYISLFAVLSIVVINAMITMSKSFRETTRQAELVQSGTILERISREIKGAYDIGSIGSTDLVLNTKDSGGANKTVEFSLSGSNVQLTENTVFTGNLNAPSIAVTALTFSQVTTTQGKAVKVAITVKSVSDPLARTEDFYDTVVLRGYYR
jgi:hypothetical protein